MLDVIDPGFDQIENDDDRSEAWTRAVSTVVQPTLVHGVPVPRFARFHSWKMGGLILNEIAAPAQIFERTEYQISSQGIDHIIVSVLTSGRSIAETTEGEYFVPTGSIRIIDLSQTYKLHSFGMRGLNVFVPRRYLGSWRENASSLHQLIVSPRKEPLARLLFDQVRNTHLCINYTDEAQRKLLAQGMVATLNAMLSSLPITKNDATSGISFDIIRFIEANLGRNDLGVDLLCFHFGLSRTPIYAIFEAHGGVMTYIRNRRLALAMRMLSGIDGNERKRVSEVAYHCGYDTLKAFSKAFKARYGMVPRDVDTAPKDGSRREAGAAMLSWILEL